METIKRQPRAVWLFSLWAQA